MLASFSRRAFSSSEPDTSIAMPSRQDASRGSRAQPTRLQNMRTGLQQLFVGRSVVGRDEERDAVPETPKTPRLPLGLQRLPSTRFNLPYLNRTTTASSVRSAVSPSPRTDIPPPSPNTPISARPITPNSYTEMRQSMSIPQPAMQSSSRPFIGVDPEEQHLAELAERGRRRRRKRSRRPTTRRLFPNMQNRKVRSKAISCLLSGTFLVIVLSTCKFSWKRKAPHFLTSLEQISPWRSRHEISAKSFTYF